MGTPPPPPLSPTVATPLAHRKRRHSETKHSDRPRVNQPGSRTNGEHKTPVKSRLEVPQGRGRSVTPVGRDRSATPSSGQKPAVTANGRPSALPNFVKRPNASPRPSIVSRPSASPRPGIASRASPSPRPKLVARAGTAPNIARRSSAASNRPNVVSRASASPHPKVAARPSPSPSVSSRLNGSPRPKGPVSRHLPIDESEDNSDESELDKSDIEDILDSAEMEPFGFGDDDQDTAALDPDAVAKLKQRLLEIGPQAFMDETLNAARMPPQVLGTAFGLGPRIYHTLGEEIFLRILTQMIVRQYHKRQKLPQYNTLDDVAELLNKCSNVIVIAGAGISTSLGIPDFRSKGSGFYARAKAKAEQIGFDLNEAEEIFSIENFDEQPELFFRLAGDILPDETRFSPTHAFIKLLQDKDKLLTCYTQNIDNLEQSAGIAKDKLIQCHGSFATATCRRNGFKNEGHHAPGTDIFPSIRAGKVAYCKQCEAEMAAKAAEKKRVEQSKKRFKLTPNKRTSTPFTDDEDEDDDIRPGVMKPDITFFGEQLPNTFFTRFTESDIKVVDLVLVLGTSLKVAPVSEMPNYLPHQVPHVYVSREAIRHVEFDVQCLGDCDDVVVELCRRAGWCGGDAKGVVGHEMVEVKDLEGRTIVVDAEEGEEEGGCARWRIKREESFL